ncbi:MAG: hypothetical protein Q9222_002391 [Ikaeria aurantiellina]
MARDAQHSGKRREYDAVSLAYFLRYPNPYAKHVLSTDVIDRHFDAVEQRLYTTRLHLKRSRLPPTVLKLLPKGILGSNNDTGQSYVLETSVVNVKDGWMTTETRNLEWTGILSVIEKQHYIQPLKANTKDDPSGNLPDKGSHGTTDVKTTTTFVSRFGQGVPRRATRKTEAECAGRGVMANAADNPPPRKGFLSSWSTSSLQRTIEAVGMRRTREALLKSKDGMNVVLGRLRSGGLAVAIEGMRRDREAMCGPDGPWKRT